MYTIILVLILGSNSWFKWVTPTMPMYVCLHMMCSNLVAHFLILRCLVICMYCTTVLPLLYNSNSWGSWRLLRVRQIFVLTDLLHTQNIRIGGPGSVRVRWIFELTDFELSDLDCIMIVDHVWYGTLHYILYNVIVYSVLYLYVMLLYNIYCMLLLYNIYCMLCYCTIYILYVVNVQYTVYHVTVHYIL